MPERHLPVHWVDVADVFGRRIAARRHDLNLTQEDLAELTGISRNQIQNIERSRNNSRTSSGARGPGNPTLDTVFALAYHLQIDVGELLTGLSTSSGEPAVRDRTGERRAPSHLD